MFLRAGRRSLRLRAIIALLALGALLGVTLGEQAGPAGVGASDALDAPDSLAAFAAPSGISGIGSSALLITNLDASAPLDAGVSLVAQGSGDAHRAERDGIAPLGTARVALDALASVPPGAYAAQVEGSGPLGLLAEAQWPRGGVSRLGTHDRGRELWLAELSKGHDGVVRSLVNVQSLDLAATAQVRIELFAEGSTEALVDHDYEIPPGASISLDLRRNSAFQSLPAEFRGWARVSADRDVAAFAFQDVPGSPLAVADAAGQAASAAARSVFAPLLAHGTERSSVVSVLNPGAGTSRVEATYHGVAGACAGHVYVQESVDLAGGTARRLRPEDARDADGSPIPDGCEASVVIRGSEAILGWVQLSTEGWERRLSGYPARGRASTAPSVLLPLGQTGPGDGGPNARVHAQNAGASTAEISLELRDARNRPIDCGAACRIVVEPGAAARWDLSDPALAAAGASRAILRAEEPLQVALLAVGEDGVRDDAAHLGHGLRDDATRTLGLPLALRAAADQASPEPPDPDPTAAPAPTEAAGASHFDELGASGLAITNPEAEGARDARLALQPVGGGGNAAELTADALAAGRSKPFFLPLEPGVGNGAFGASLRADGPAGAFARTDWFRSGAAVAQLAGAPARSLLIPRVVKDRAGETSAVALRNGGMEAREVVAQILGDGAAQPVLSLSLRLPAKGTTVLRFDTHPSLAELPDGFGGWMRISADGPIAAVALTQSAEGVGVHSLPGVDEAGLGDRLITPLLRSRTPLDDGRGGGPRLDGSLELRNPGTASLLVRVRARGQAGDDLDVACRQLDAEVARVELPPGGSWSGGAELLPAGCRASLELRAEGGGLLAWVRTDEARAGGAAAYLLADPSEARLRHVLPYVRREHTDARFVSPVHMWNAGDGPARVRVQLFDDQGDPLSCGAPCELEIPAGGADRWWPPTAEELPPFRYGEAIVTSDAPLELLVEDLALAQPVDLVAFPSIRAGAPDEGELPLLLANARLQDGGAVPAPLQSPLLALPSKMPAPENGILDVAVELAGRGHALQRAALRLEYDERWLALPAQDADEDGLPDAVRLHQDAGFELRVPRGGQMGEGALDLEIVPRGESAARLADGTLLSLRLARYGEAPRDAGWLRFSDAPRPALWDAAEVPWLPETRGGWFRVEGRVFLPWLVLRR